MSRFIRLFFTCVLGSLFVLPFSCSPQAQGGTILDYSFPASWDGLGGAGAAVTDLSPAGNDGVTSGGAALSANIPVGAPAGTMSLNASGQGGVLTNAADLMENPALEAAGGFVFAASIYWDGNDGNRTVQKIIDNEGTDSLQLANIDSSGGTADLVFSLNDTGILSLPIVANTWYDAQAIFDTQGNSIDGNGDLAGLATLVANANMVSGAATRTTGAAGSSDQFNRPIAIGVLALPAAPTLVNFSGDIYNPTVTLVPEPGSLVLLVLGSFGLLVSILRAKH